VRTRLKGVLVCLFGFGASKDQVHGYNIVDTQNGLVTGANLWTGWKNNIKNTSNNGTEQHLDALFNTWLNY